MLGLNYLEEENVPLNCGKMILFNLFSNVSVLDIDNNIWLTEWSQIRSIRTVILLCEE